MVGLAMGSWAGGNAARTIATTSVSPLWLYGLVEAGIGLGAFVLPSLFGSGESVLLSFGDMDSTRYLMTSAVLIAVSILPWCLCMGATYPAAMAYMKRQNPKDTSGFSYLYLANVVGAMLGALLTAIVLVETLGFSNTLRLGAACNGLIALISFVMAAKDRSKPLKAEPRAPRVTAAQKAQTQTVLWVLFLTGFASMAMEVVWTRAFTPALRTTIYAFAMLLAMYLIATWAGSAWYRRSLRRGKLLSAEKILLWLAIAACLPVVLNDPRLYLRGVGALLSIFPFCFLLGYLTPMLIDRYCAGEPKRAGFAYAVNIVGCVLGPLVAGYWLLPWIGVKWSLILLALPFFYWVAPALKKRPSWGLAGTAVVLLILSIGPSRTYEEQMKHGNAVVRRDHTATVISSGEGAWKQMYVNGISITYLTPITKLMAHFPLAALPEAPQKALVICFGMGTTFRSLLSWNLDAWAAELVPSVKEAFGYYFKDADELLARPNAHVVIDDGRRFLRRTQEKFDVITLDPPPPIEAAGSSLLYSTQFYEQAKERLTPQGILHQWFPGGEERVLHAISASLVESFPYIRVFRSLEGYGFHFLASRNPLDSLQPERMVARMPASAQNDLVEWYPGQTPRQVIEAFLSKEVPLKDVLGEKGWKITDDRPLNEYYLLRRFFARG